MKSCFMNTCLGLVHLGFLSWRGDYVGRIGRHSQNERSSGFLFFRNGRRSRFLFLRSGGGILIGSRRGSSLALGIVVGFVDGLDRVLDSDADALRGVLYALGDETCTSKHT